jgi:hypothetical protein
MKEIKALLKLEAALTRLLVRKIVLVSLGLFPAFARQAGVSYLALFVLAVIGLGSAQLYSPMASLGDRTYVVLVMLLSFSYTTRALVFGLQEARKRLAPTEAPSSAPFGGRAFIPSLAVLSGFLMFSLVPPIVVFAFQRLGWALSFCLWGLFLSFLAAIILTITAVFSTRFRDWLPRFLKRIPRIDSVHVAGLIYHAENR